MLPISMRILLLILCVTYSSFAATYYVDTDDPGASDSNPGSEAQPWATIQKAATTATAGDTVNVKAGTYNEYITFSNSGTDGSPIQFIGERGGSGEWLTIIDPSTDASSGWSAATEIGSGVFKKDVGLETDELTIDGQRVAFVTTTNTMSSWINEAYTGSGMTTGADVLLLSSSAVLESTLTGADITFWDSVGALYAASGNTTYLRIRNGLDPSGMNIRVAANKSGTVNPTDFLKPALILDDRSYLVIKNFKIQNSFGGLRMWNAGCSNNIVVSNYIQNGYCRVSIASGAGYNIISNNYLVCDYYGYADIGAWAGSVSGVYADRENLYLVSKFLMGQTSSFDDAVKLISQGTSNYITGNIIQGSLGTGVNFFAGGTGTVLNSNIVANHPSVGVIFSAGQVGTMVYDNLISDCNANMRYHHMNQVGESERTVYIFRNKLWLPEDIGDHTFIHFFGNASSYYPEFWTYWNSYSGGEAAISVGITVANYDIQNISGCRWVNNVFSGVTSWINNINIDFFTDAGMVGAFDYNELTPPYLTYPTDQLPAWAGEHNVISGNPEWDVSSMPNWILSSAASPAVDAALDTTGSFTLQGDNFSALPVNGEEKVGPAWDIGALEHDVSLKPRKPRRNGPGRFRGM